MKHLVTSLADLDALNVAFLSLRDNLDLSAPSGRLMMQLLGTMAEFERALSQERVKAGLAHARAKGKRLGRPRRTLDQAEVAVPRDSGLSWREVGARVGCNGSLALRIFARDSGRCENPLQTPVASA